MGEATTEELVLLDTGSSTLGFCNKSLQAELADKKTDEFTCNLYGHGFHGWWGFFYQGGVSVQSIEPLPNVYYSVMQQEVEFCIPVQGPGGIFGIGFKYLNRAHQPPTPTDWSQDQVGSCPPFASGAEEGNPLIQT